MVKGFICIWNLLQRCAADHFPFGLKVHWRGLKIWGRGCKNKKPTTFGTLASRSVDFMFLLKGRRTNSSARQGRFVSYLPTHPPPPKKATTTATKQQGELSLTCFLYGNAAVQILHQSKRFRFYCVRDQPVDDLLYPRNGWKPRPRDQGIWPGWKPLLLFSPRSANRGRGKAFANIANDMICITRLHRSACNTARCYKRQTRRKTTRQSVWIT